VHLVLGAIAADLSSHWGLGHHFEHLEAKKPEHSSLKQAAAAAAAAHHREVELPEEMPAAGLRAHCGIDNYSVDSAIDNSWEHGLSPEELAFGASPYLTGQRGAHWQKHYSAHDSVLGSEVAQLVVGVEQPVVVQRGQRAG
jgi:hypothetical protein